MDRIWIWFADNGNIRKWQREPFEEGTEFVASLPPVNADPVASDLVERLQERAGSYRSSTPSAEHTAILLEEAAAAIIALQGEVQELNKLLSDGANGRTLAAEAEVARLNAELERLHDLDTCMCGSRMDDHDIGSGHSPVSMFDYYRSQDEEEIKRLNAEMAEAHRVIEPFAAYTTLPSMPDNHLCLIEARHLRRARSFRDGQKTGECATEGCNSPATVFFERGGVGSHYCQPCYLKIQALPAATQKGASDE